MVRYFGSIIS